MSEPVSFATFEKVRAERDRLASQGVRDRELLVMVTVERDRLRALVRRAVDNELDWERDALALLETTRC